MMFPEVLRVEQDPEDVVPLFRMAGTLLKPRYEGILIRIPIPYAHVPTLFALPENRGIQNVRFYLYTV